MSTIDFGPKVIYRTGLTYNNTSALQKSGNADQNLDDELGIIRFVLVSTAGWQTFKFVQVATGTTVANGTVLVYGAAAGDTTAPAVNRTIVTDDISDQKQNGVAGVGIGAITAASYGWIQLTGYHSVVKTNGDDDIAYGDVLIVDSTTDGTCNSVAAGTAPTHIVLGVARAADVDADNTVAAWLMVSP